MDELLARAVARGALALVLFPAFPLDSYGQGRAELEQMRNLQIATMKKDTAPWFRNLKKVRVSVAIGGVDNRLAMTEKELGEYVCHRLRKIGLEAIVAPRRRGPIPQIGVSIVTGKFSEDIYDYTMSVAVKDMAQCPRNGAVIPLIVWKLDSHGTFSDPNSLELGVRRELDETLAVLEATYIAGNAKESPVNAALKR